MSGQVSVLPLAGTLSLTGKSDRSRLYRMPRSIDRFKLVGDAATSTSASRIVSFGNEPYVPSNGAEERSASWYPLWEARLRVVRETCTQEVGLVWPSPSPLAGSHAAEFLDKLRVADKPPTNISQSAIGGIAFTFLQDDNEVFVEFLNDGRLFAAVSRLDEIEEDFPTYEFGQGEFDYDHLVEVISNAINA